MHFFVHRYLGKHLVSKPSTQLELFVCGVLSSHMHVKTRPALSTFVDPGTDQ